MKIKVVITDDHPMMVDGVKSLLSEYPHIMLLNSYFNGDDLLRGLSQQQPDVLLLDIQLPGKGGDELAPLILKRYPDIRILVLTNFDSGLYANNMFKRGVHGYLLKTAGKERLLQAIETVNKGEIFVEPSMKEKIEQMDYKVKSTVFSKNTLTSREKEILQYIVNGDTSQEIADKLFLSINTILNYRTSVMLKLDAKNMAILVKKALKMGLVD